MYNNCMAIPKRYKVGADDWRRRLRPTSDIEYRRRLRSRCIVDKRTGCWIYQGPTFSTGYGAFWFRGKTDKVHRVAFILFKGPLSPRKLACHNCPFGDNPLCINPAHLWAGTSKDNSEDMVRKGRAATGLRNGKHTKPECTPRGKQSGSAKHPEKFQGELNGFVKLTEAQVIEIRKRYAAGGISQQRLADEYSIVQNLVSKIVLRRAWRHV